MGIKNKKLTKGDLVTCKQRHRALPAPPAPWGGRWVSRGSLGIVKVASDERIVIHWFDLNKDGLMSPTDARKRLSKISRPKK